MRAKPVIHHKTRKSKQTEMLTLLRQIQRAVATSLHEHWVLFLVEGIILVILGVAAIILPPIATLAVEILFGWLFLISGIAGLITTFMMRQAPGFWWSLVSAMLGIAVGIVLLAWPLNGILTLTFILIVYFTIEGIASIMFALEHKRELSGRWGWMLASGVIDLILAEIISLPGTAAGALGLLVGINMVFGGTALVALKRRGRQQQQAEQERQREAAARERRRRHEEQDRQQREEQERQWEAAARERRRRQEEQNRRRDAAPGTMSAGQALEILGLKAGATEQEIRAAYNRLMKRVHPDSGGTNFFAKQLNDARDALLGRRTR
jgi:uncharacterized membrane protein HdeD (DUF308 family)